MGLKPERAFDLYVKSTNGVGPEQLLVKMGAPAGWPEDWSRDGRFIIYQIPGTKTGQDLWIAPQPSKVGNQQAISVFAVRVRRKAWPVLSRRPLGGLQFERIGPGRSIRADFSTVWLEISDHHGWRPGASVAERWQRSCSISRKIGRWWRFL